MEQLEYEMYNEAQEVIGTHLGGVRELLHKVCRIGFSEDVALKLIQEENDYVEECKLHLESKAKEITKTVSVKLTESQIDWIINECEHWQQGNDDDGDTRHIGLAKKLQGRLESRGLEQSHPFGRKPTAREIADAKFFKLLK